MSDDLKRLIQELPDALTIPKAPRGTEIMKRGLGRRSRSRLLALAATATTVGLVWIALFHYSWGPFAHQEFVHFRTGSGSTRSLGLASPDASRPGWTVHSNPAKGYVIETPHDWKVSWGFGDQYMYVGNYRFGVGRFCGRGGALTIMPRKGTFFWMFENQSGSGFDFTPRPSSFALDPGTLAPYEGMGCQLKPGGSDLRQQMYRFTFKDSGRYFVVYMGFGPRAGASVRKEALQALDSFRVAS
jgi:hypothetical protein